MFENEFFIFDKWEVTFYLFPHISLHSSFCQRCRSFSSLPFVCLVCTHGLEFAWRTAHFPVKLVFYKSQTLRRNWRTPFFERISLYKWGPWACVKDIRRGCWCNATLQWADGIQQDTGSKRRAIRKKKGNRSERKEVVVVMTGLSSIEELSTGQWKEKEGNSSLWNIQETTQNQ